MKRRVILDIKESGIRASTKRRYRILLPRSIDAVNGSLELLSLCLAANGIGEEEREEVEYLVLDEADRLLDLGFEEDVVTGTTALQCVAHRSTCTILTVIVLLVYTLMVDNPLF